MNHLRDPEPSLTLSPAEAGCDGNARRRAEIDRRQQKLESLLTELGYEGLLLTAPENFAWFTCGGDCRWGMAGDMGWAALFIGEGNRVLLCHASAAEPLFSGPLRGLGFQLKVRPSLTSFEELLDEVCRGRRVASDTGYGRTRAIGQQIDEFRRELSSWETQLLRDGILQLRQAVAAAAEGAQPGLTPTELRGQLAASLYQRNLVPMQINVHHEKDEPSAGGETTLELPQRKGFGVQIVIRKDGLAIPVTETILFGHSTAVEAAWLQLAERYLQAATEQATPGQTWGEMWRRWKLQLRSNPPPGDAQPVLQIQQLGYRWPEHDCAADLDTQISAAGVYFWQLKLAYISLGAVTGLSRVE